MTGPQTVRPRYRINGAVAAGYVLWVTLVAWFTSPASPSWPETLVAAPVALVAVYLVQQGRPAK